MGLEPVINSAPFRKPEWIAQHTVLKFSKRKAVKGLMVHIYKKVLDREPWEPNMMRVLDSGTYGWLWVKCRHADSYCPSQWTCIIRDGCMGCEDRLVHYNKSNTYSTCLLCCFNEIRRLPLTFKNNARLSLRVTGHCPGCSLPFFISFI